MTSSKDRIEIVEGDIAATEVDVIVNSANNTLLGGGGGDGAIHRAAGGNLISECMNLRGCATGEAKITGGYDLRAKWVIHTVGPIWSGGRRKEDQKLASCYRNSLTLAAEHSAESIAFPAISTGANGFPIERAAQICFQETRRFLSENETIRKVIFVCFDREMVEVYERFKNLPEL